MIKLVVNGSEVIAHEMENLKVFLERIGKDVLGLCHHEKIISSGKCDLCLVEVDHEVVRSCDYFISSSISITTNSESLSLYRKFSFENLSRNHKTDCEKCHQSGVCTIQNFARNSEIELQRNFTSNNTVGVKEPLGDNYFLDYDRCVSCSLCIDYSQKIAKDNLFYHAGRGDRTYVGVNHVNTEQSYLGLYRDLCPTGAIYHKEDHKLGERGSFKDVKCLGCEKACTFSARTVAKRFIDLRVSKIELDYTCEAGREWWRKVDLWRARDAYSALDELGNLAPVSEVQIKDLIPQDLNWQIILPGDLDSQESKQWALFLSQKGLTAKFLKPTKDKFFDQLGELDPYFVVDEILSNLEIISDAGDLGPNILLVEPLWHYSPDFLQEFRSKSKYLILLSDAIDRDGLCDIQVDRNAWVKSPLLPPRQNASIQAIMEVLNIRK